MATAAAGFVFSARTSGLSSKLGDQQSCTSFTSGCGIAVPNLHSLQRNSAHAAIATSPEDGLLPRLRHRAADRHGTSSWIRPLHADTSRDLGDHSSMQLPQFQIRHCCTHLFVWPWPHCGRAFSMEARRAASMGWICPKGLRPLKSSKPTVKWWATRHSLCDTCGWPGCTCAIRDFLVLDVTLAAPLHRPKWASNRKESPLTDHGVGVDILHHAIHPSSALSFL